MRICNRCLRKTADDHETICLQCGAVTEDYIEPKPSFRKDKAVSKGGELPPLSE